MSHTEAPLEFIEKYYTDDLAERGDPEGKFALRWAKMIKGRSVLNVGCGPQFYDDVQFFGEIPREYVGIDINENNIRFLKESRHPELEKWKSFLAARGVAVELKNASIKEKQDEWVGRFDAIYAVGVLGMFDKEETRTLFGYLHSYLKKGGVLVDVDWTEPYLSEKKLKERKSYEWYSKNGPNIGEIGKLLERSGFEIAEHDAYAVPDPKKYLWGKIYAYIAVKL